MANVIYLKDENGNLTTLKETAYSSEDVFQKLLEDYPALLTGEGEEENGKWVLLSREMGVPEYDGGSSQWFLDHLFVDKNATPILVEVKRSTDTRIRREVVGQMLDYAANATLYWDIEDIKKKFEDNGGNIVEEYGFDDGDVEKFWKDFENNLRLAKIKLIFVADQIPSTLLRIIEFLNNQMVNTEVLGIEIKQYVENGKRQILVPKVLGQTLQANITKKTEKRKWDRESFLEDVTNVGGSNQAKLLDKLLDECESIGCTFWYGEGKDHASVMIMHVDSKGKKHYFVRVPVHSKDVRLEFQFAYFIRPFDNEELRVCRKDKLENALGIKVDEQRADKYPSYPLGLLEDDEKYTAFVAYLKWMLEEIKKVD